MNKYQQQHTSDSITKTNTQIYKHPKWLKGHKTDNPYVTLDHQLQNNNKIKQSEQEPKRLPEARTKLSSTQQESTKK